MPNNLECLVGFKVLEKGNRDIYNKLVCHGIYAFHTFGCDSGS